MIRPGDGFTRGVRSLCLLLLLLPLTAQGQADPSGRMVFGRWRASALGQTARGQFSLLQDAQGFLRLDLRRDAASGHAPETGPLSPESRRQLLTWGGAGWCAVQGEPGEGTLGPWREQWHRLGVPLGVWLDLAATFLHTGILPPGRLAGFGVTRLPVGEIHTPRPRFRDGTGPIRVARFLVPPLVRFGAKVDPPAVADAQVGPETFRSRQVQAAQGRGWDREIMTLARAYASSGELRSLTLSSSQKPGAVHLDHLTAQPVIYRPDEVFVPLWPLADILPALGEENGNPVVP